MSEVKRYKVITAEINAMQIIEGATTKRQILDFCPGAGVGAPGTEKDEQGMDSTDLKWVQVPTRNGGQEAQFGDWLIEGPAGTRNFFVRDDEYFWQNYAEIARLGSRR